MKTNRFLLSLAALILCLSINAQNKIFDKYNEMRSVSSVYISKAMIDMQSNVFAGDVYIGKMAGQLDGVYIISTRDANIKKELRQDLNKFIASEKYELLMKQKSTVSSSSFYIKSKGNKVKELVMITDGAATLKFISLIGDFSLKDIQNIAKSQDTSYHFHFDKEQLTAALDNIELPDIKDFNFDFDFDFDFDADDLKDLKGLENLKDLKDLKKLEKLKDSKSLNKLNGLKIKMEKGKKVTTPKVETKSIDQSKEGI